MREWITADLESTPRLELTHGLGSALEHFATIRRRKQLLLDPIYRRHADEVTDVLEGFEWDLSRGAQIPASRALRAVAWNIERGKRWRDVAGLLREHPELVDAELVLLNEVDIGMGRSGNVNVPRELARALGYNYVYCNFELLLSPGDAFERGHDDPNRLAMHGAALLTRLPVSRLAAVTLPEFTDKFHADEKRLGGKRALMCEVLTGSGPVTVVVPHLDPFAGPRHRARQMQRVVRNLERWGNHCVLLGGDLNTNTYDFGTRRGLAVNVAHKLVRLGFDETIRQYMTPERIYERGTFEVMHAAGLSIEGFNARELGTTVYDIHDPELRDWTTRYVPRPARVWLERRLRPWGGAVPLRIDWFAGRGLRPLHSTVVDRPRAPDGGLLSDHNPMVVAFEPERSPATTRRSFSRLRG
jgi:endonuclease/exonuclease/phosphatase family metal-dependent hydrolase